MKVIIFICVIPGSDSGFSIGVQGPPGPPGPPGPASGSLTVSALITMLQRELAHLLKTDCAMLLVERYCNKY